MNSGTETAKKQLNDELGKLAEGYAKAWIDKNFKATVERLIGKRPANRVLTHSGERRWEVMAYILPDIAAPAIIYA